MKSEASGSRPEAFAGWKTAFVISFFLQTVQNADAEAGGAFGRQRMAFVVFVDAGNVQMRPFDAFFDEALQETGGGDAAGQPGTCVFHVGNVRIPSVCRIPR